MCWSGGDGPSKSFFKFGVICHSRMLGAASAACCTRGSFLVFSNLFRRTKGIFFKAYTLCI